MRERGIHADAPSVGLRVVAQCVVALGIGASARGQSTLHVFEGPPQGWAGWSVAAVGDADGDGVPDVAFGIPLADAGRGRVELRSGADGGLLHGLDGSNPGDLFGWAVSAAGDLDGDGRADLLVGVPGDESLDVPGAAEVYSGSTGLLLRRVEGQQAGARFGYAVAGAGDLDGDLIPDLLVGAPNSSGRGFLAGSARTFSGAHGQPLHVFDGAAGQQLGSAVASIGDVDDDGVGDLLVGAPGMINQLGRAWVFSGRSGRLVHELWGELPGDRFGHAVDDAGDVDGDGVPDVIVGAPSGGANGAGLARVHSGRTGDLIFACAGSSPQDRFGWAVSSAGDVDLDGRADVMVGSPTSWSEGQQRGSIHLFGGGDGHLLYSHAAAEQLEWFGEALDELGDVNADGIPDLVVGAPYELPTAAGRTRVLQGWDEPAPRYCFGDEPLRPCPCGNASAPNRGCANSAGSGAILTPVPSRSLSVDADELRLTVLRLVPVSPSVLFAGHNRIEGGLGSAFGDGLRCAGGGVIRLAAQLSGPAGSATWGPGLAAANGWDAGESWNFQVLYRDTAGPCGIGFNLSNGVAVTLTP